MKLNQSFLYLIGVLFILSCGQQSDENAAESDKDSIENRRLDMPEVKKVDLVKVGELTEAIITSIPSSPEVELLFNEMGMQYQMDLLNPIEHVSKYQLISDKAINLGIYLCDLGYISAFDQTQELIFYINCSKKLSEGIGVSDIIDEATIENLELNIDNEDSLQTIIRRIYDQTYVFLDENNRLSTATLLVSGGWIEGLYIATQIIDMDNPHPRMINNLIRQRAVYDRLIELLSNFNEDPAVYKIRNDLRPIGPLLYRLQNDSKDNKKTLLELKEKITGVRSDCIVF